MAKRVHDGLHSITSRSNSGRPTRRSNCGSTVLRNKPTWRQRALSSSMRMEADLAAPLDVQLEILPIYSDFFVPRFIECRIAKGVITRSLEGAAAIAASRPELVGVLQSLHAYTIHASARFYCRGERPIPAHRRASNTVSSRVRPQPRRVCPNASWPRTAGATASERY